MQVTDEMVLAAWEAYDNAPGYFTNSELMRAALTAALAAMWRPISEAPTNTAILIKLPNLDYYGNSGIYEAMLVDMGSGKRWHTFGYAVGRDLGGDWEPTHFMLIPSPPEKE